MRRRRHIDRALRVMLPVWALVLAVLPLCSGQEDGLDPAPAGSFTIVVIPDTQRYLGRGTKSQPDSTAPVTNPVFAAHTRWIADNIEEQRIAFVSHVGDIVDRNVPDQWQVARACMDQLHGRIPYGLSVGNHDTKSSGDSSLFQETFPASRFAAFPWYGGSFPADPERPAVSGNNANSFQLISAGGVDFVILHLECNAPDPVLAWADEILHMHADRWAIVTTHMYLGPIEKPATNQGYKDDPKGRMCWRKVHGKRGNTPQQLWEKCFRKHANLMMICAGDQSRTSACTMASTGEHGNTVHELMSDYTSSGPLRLYRFIPAEKRIQVITYDTSKRKLVTETAYVPGTDNHQFVLYHDFAAHPARRAAAAD